MNEHALDAMIYAWMVMKEKEESSMEGIFMGQITGSVSSVEDGEIRAAQIYFSGTESNACGKLSHYNKTYSLVLSDDVIKTNDELLKLRDEVKELKIQIEMLESVEQKYWELMAEHTKLQEEHTKLEDELAEIKTTRNLREAYISGVEKGCESLREERDRWKRRWNSVVTDIGKSLESNGIEFTLKEIHGDGNWDVVIDIPELNEAKDKIIELEQKVRDERKWCDYWRHTYYAAEKVASVVGVSIKIDGIESQHNSAKVIVQNDKAEELKKQVVQMDDLEKKLKAAKSNETYWRDRKEEEEDYHYYWVHTYDRVVKQAAEKGVYINVTGTDEDCNAGIVIVTNNKAQDLEKQVVQMEDANQKLRQRISAADKEIEKLKNREGIAYWRDTYYSAVEKAKAEGVTIVMQGMDLDANVANIKVMNHRTASLERRIKLLEDDVVAAKDRGDYWKRSYDDLAEYWDNTRKDLVARGKKVGVKIEFKGDDPDNNAGDFDITNEKAIELMVKVSDTKHEYNKKWQAMTNALKDKGVEVIYMGEEDEKPIIDIKVPEWDSDKQWVRDFAKRCADLWADKFRLERERDELKEQCDILRKDYIVRGQAIDDLKKELEALKSRTLDNVEIRLSCGDIVWTYCDGFVHVSSGIISSDEIDTRHINCLCKNYFDAESISHGTVPKCSSCAHYMHNPSRFAHDWCYMPIPKEGGAGYIRKLNKEEAEGPACSDFKAKE